MNKDYLSVIDINDVKKLNVLIEKCVSKLISYLNDIHIIHLNRYKKSSYKDCNNEPLDVINNNFNELFNYLNVGYDLVKSSDLSLQWYFLEHFWFLVNSKSFLNIVEKNNLRGQIEYIEYKINMLVRKYKNK